jgi:hypothetical protein
VSALRSCSTHLDEKGIVFVCIGDIELIVVVGRCVVVVHGTGIGGWEDGCHGKRLAHVRRCSSAQGAMCQALLARTSGCEIAHG